MVLLGGGLYGLRLIDIEILPFVDDGLVVGEEKGQFVGIECIVDRFSIRFSRGQNDSMPMGRTRRGVVVKVYVVMPLSLQTACQLFILLRLYLLLQVCKRVPKNFSYKRRDDPRHEVRLRPLREVGRTRMGKLFA